MNKNVFRTILIALPMMLLTFIFLTRGRIPHDPIDVFATALTFIFFNAIFILMIHTSKTDQYRSILFTTFAISFVISFITHLIELRGSMAITETTMLEGQTPFCHIVIPMTLIPAALTKTIIFPGTIIGGFASISSMFVLWIGASLALGRGFCSWVCFFGGLDEGFSRVFNKPIIKNINIKWTYLPYAVLFVIVVIAALTLSPTYCEWLCPYKTVTEFVEVTSLKILIQTIIFVSLFIGLVIVLPLLTKRRTQCGLFCPFGAFQSFTNKVSPFEILVDTEKCVKCKRCIQACPTFSIDEESIDRGRTRITCTRCGRCVDLCPKKAPFYHVKGTPSLSTVRSYRTLFLYPAFLFLATMAGGNIKDAILKVIKLLTTGSMI